MRHEKFGRLKILRRAISNNSELPEIKNLDNLQFMNIEIIGIKPEFTKWVSHICSHNELIRDTSCIEEYKVKVSRTGRLYDSNLWLGVCPICLKYIIGVQKAPPAKSQSKGKRVYESFSAEQTYLKKAELEAEGHSVKVVRSLERGTYNLYIV